MPVLEIKNLKIDLLDAEGNKKGRILRGLDLTMDAGEKLALVGESGCGKSMTALTMMNLLPTRRMKITEGSMTFNDRDLLKLKESDWPAIRGKEIGIIFQDPLTALNPVMTVGKQVEETLRSQAGIAKDPLAEVARLFSEMGLPDPKRIYHQYPHQLSGGMCQRICIAMALAASPQLLVADEPTTALDVTVQSQILQLLKNEMEARKFALLFITHNLRLVQGFCERIAVIYAGQVVETGLTGNVLKNPMHPYTESLLAAMPDRGKTGDSKVDLGWVPTPTDEITGCSFAARCNRSKPECSKIAPLATRKNERTFRCFYPL